MTTTELRLIAKSIKPGDLVEAGYAAFLKRAGIKHRQQFVVEQVKHIKGKADPMIKLKGLEDWFSVRFFQKTAPVDQRKAMWDAPFEVGEKVVAKQGHFSETQGLPGRVVVVTETNGSPSKRGQYIKVTGINRFLVASSFESKSKKRTK